MVPPPANPSVGHSRGLTPAECHQGTSSKGSSSKGEAKMEPRCRGNLHGTLCSGPQVQLTETPCRGSFQGVPSNEPPRRPPPVEPLQGAPPTDPLKGSYPGNHFRGPLRNFSSGVLSGDSLRGTPSGGPFPGTTSAEPPPGPPSGVPPPVDSNWRPPTGYLHQEPLKVRPPGNPPVENSVRPTK
jgi:hypothetical protein